MPANDMAALRKRLAGIAPAVKEAVMPALQKSGDELVATMQHLAPVDTGALRESITATPAGQATPAYSQGDGGGGEIVPEGTVRVTAGDADARYAHLVEHGTAEAPAQPFFYPAFRSARARIAERVKRAVIKAAKEEWAK